MITGQKKYKNKKRHLKDGLDTYIKTGLHNFKYIASRLNQAINQKTNPDYKDEVRGQLTCSSFQRGSVSFRSTTILSHEWDILTYLPCGKCAYLIYI